MKGTKQPQETQMALNSIEVKNIAINLNNKIVAARYILAETGSREKLNYYTEKLRVLGAYARLKGLCINGILS